ncbi:ATPase [Myxococcota bacterium]|nr:ATPase [Myxococcota bacterium]
MTENENTPEDPRLRKGRDSTRDSELRQTLVGMIVSDVEGLENDENVEIWEATQTPQPLQEKIVEKLIPVTRPRLPDEPAFLPGTPPDINATGLTWSFIEELILKHLFQGGTMRGTDIVYRTTLPQNIVEEALEHLRKQQYLEITGAARAGLGRSQMLLRMTQAGLDVCKTSLERDKYVGPAPVPWKYYLKAVSAQSIRSNHFRKEDLEPHFHDLVLDEGVFEAIGPAMNSGQSLFFHGPPGNGKTAICQRMTNCFGGDVFIPYAVLVDDFVIKIFDENLHKVSGTEDDPRLDSRWVRCKRPMVVVGGELLLADLELAYSEGVKFYEAPIQMKANNGLLLVDDFGRQKVSPRELLNRWIVPLESEIDFVSLHTGKKLQIPFDVFVVFSTNLDPKALVDDAFLRRVRYKLEVKRPSEILYKNIFAHECENQEIPWDGELFDYLINEHYKKSNRPMNACEPRDLLAQVRDLCAYNGFKPSLTKEIIDRVVANYFVRF